MGAMAKRFSGDYMWFSGNTCVVLMKEKSSGQLRPPVAALRRRPMLQNLPNSDADQSPLRRSIPRLKIEQEVSGAFLVVLGKPCVVLKREKLSGAIDERFSGGRCKVLRKENLSGQLRPSTASIRLVLNSNVEGTKLRAQPLLFHQLRSTVFSRRRRFFRSISGHLRPSKAKLRRHQLHKNKAVHFSPLFACFSFILSFFVIRLSASLGFFGSLPLLPWLLSSEDQVLYSLTHWHIWLNRNADAMEHKPLHSTTSLAAFEEFFFDMSIKSPVRVQKFYPPLAKEVNLGTQRLVLTCIFNIVFSLVGRNFVVHAHILTKSTCCNFLS